MNTIRIWTAALAGTLVLGASNAHANEELDTMRQFLDVVGSYVEYNHRWIELVESEEGVAQMSAEGIAELHEQRGRPLDAIPALRELAQRYPEGSTARRLVHWKMKDIYKDAGKRDEALEELENFTTGG